MGRSRLSVDADLRAHWRLAGRQFHLARCRVLKNLLNRRSAHDSLPLRFPHRKHRLVLACRMHNFAHGRLLVVPLSDPVPRTPSPWTNRRVALNGDRLRLLVVDDNCNAALAMAAYLSAEAVEARAVFGGLEAIDMVRAWTPHVILMDITMPHCDGYQVTHALRQDPCTGQVLIIAHTALDEAEVRRHQVMGDEFDGYAQKGWPPTQLLALVRILAA